MPSRACRPKSNQVLTRLPPSRTPLRPRFPPTPQVCMELSAAASCPDLGSFCHNSANSGSCFYTMFNDNKRCCPTTKVPLP